MITSPFALKFIFWSVLSLAFILPNALLAQSKLLNPRTTQLDLLMPDKPSSIPPPADVETLVKEFFLLIQAGKVKEAYTKLLDKSDLEAKEMKVEDLTIKTETMQREFGVLNGYELYHNKALGKRIMHLVYFSYHPKMPLRWRFTLYAGIEGDWRIINLSVDDLVIDSILQ